MHAFLSRVHLPGEHPRGLRERRGISALTTGRFDGCAFNERNASNPGSWQIYRVMFSLTWPGGTRMPAYKTIRALTSVRQSVTILFITSEMSLASAACGGRWRREQADMTQCFSLVSAVEAADGSHRCSGSARHFDRGAGE